MSQTSTPVRHVISHNGKLVRHTRFLSPSQADSTLESLFDEIGWRDHIGERWVSVYSSPDSEITEFNYRGCLIDLRPWGSVVNQIASQISQKVNLIPNFVLINLFRHQGDWVDWHSDAEDGFGEDPVMVTVSLGDTRIMQFRPKKSPNYTVSTGLEHGNLLVMSEGFQENWEQAILLETLPKTCTVTLTFGMLQ